jgi:hypothetical protein
LSSEITCEYGWKIKRGKSYQVTRRSANAAPSGVAGLARGEDAAADIRNRLLTRAARWRGTIKPG